jgi:hypothetical protein
VGPDCEVSEVTVKRAALLLSVAYVLSTAVTLHWELRALLQIEWPPLGRLGFPGVSQIFSLLISLSWAAYFAFIYRERSLRRNPVSLWAITLWTAAITVATAVSSAVQFLLFVTAHRAGFATGHTAWARSTPWRLSVSYTTMALWIALIVLLAHDPRGQRTRRIAAALATVMLLTGLFDSYRLVCNEAQWWEQTLAHVWRTYPLTALWEQALAPAINVFRNVCTVLFTFAVWKEIGPRVPQADAAPK